MIDPGGKVLATFLEHHTTIPECTITKSGIDVTLLQHALWINWVPR